MKVLVTGGAGYIGSHVCELLVAQGHEVTVFDNLGTGHRAAVHPEAHFAHGDLLERAAVARLFRAARFDGIMHFAARTLVGESVQHPWRYLRDNVLAAQNLLAAAAEQGVKRFIFSSTANLYGRATRMPIAEDESVAPGSPYGESKYLVERQLAWMSQLHGMSCCSLRYFNAAGAHPAGHIGEDHRPETHLIPLMLQVALGQREALGIHGEDYDTPDGTCIRDYVQVMDLAEAHILALAAFDDGRNRVFNLGSGRGFSVREALRAARHITGHSIPTRSGPRRAGDVARLVADSTRIRAATGWQPRHDTLETIIATAWEWHRRHPQGFAD